MKTIGQSPSARILIAENDPVNVQLLTDICLAEDLEVTVATDGAETLSSIAAELPDLVLMDVMMPEMDGFEVLQRLRSSPRTRCLPVILITAVSDDDSIRYGYKIGANDYITKPFKVAELVARMRSLVQASHFRKLSAAVTPWEVGNEESLRETLTELADLSSPQQLSLVVLDLEQLLLEHGEAADTGLIVELGASVRRQLRGIDQAFILPPHRLALLLAETDAGGATSVAQRLIRHLFHRVSAHDAEHRAQIAPRVFSTAPGDEPIARQIQHWLAALDLAGQEPLASGSPEP